jgi:hypothetical protein
MAAFRSGMTRAFLPTVLAGLALLASFFAVPRDHSVALKPWPAIDVRGPR